MRTKEFLCSEKRLERSWKPVLNEQYLYEDANKSMLGESRKGSKCANLPRGQKQPVRTNQAPFNIGFRIKGLSRHDPLIGHVVPKK